MAGAGQPFYMPLTWPVGHVTSAIFGKSDDDVPPKPNATADLDAIGHMTSCFAATRSFLIAYICIYGLYDHANHPYPAFGAAQHLAAWRTWAWPIITRNFLLAWLICGSWDWFLYFSPWAPKLHKYKLNPNYPSRQQFVHDAFFTSTATLMMSLLECITCHLWASGVLKYQYDLSETPISNFLWAITITHWRVPHFWLMHRGMHPWFSLHNKSPIPDVGRFLYKHVHSLHHKSYNPTAFSGTSMHPIESFTYFTAALICVPFGCHPTIFLGCVMDCAVGAWLGHDGFQWPGSGDYFHQLHHMYFECNYGAMHVPMDKWLGTFCAGKDKDKMTKNNNNHSNHHNDDPKGMEQRMLDMREEHELHAPGTSIKKDE